MALSRLAGEGGGEGRGERLPMSRGQGEMSMLSVEKGGLVVRLAIAAHRDDDAQPDIGQHADGFAMALPAVSGPVVVRSRPRTMAQTTEGEQPHGLPQGTDARPSNSDEASAAARFCDRRSASLALGDRGVGITRAVAPPSPAPPGAG